MHDDADALRWAAGILGGVTEHRMVYQQGEGRAVTYRVRGAVQVAYLKVGADLGNEVAALRGLAASGGEVAGLRLPVMLGHRAGTGGEPDLLLTAEVPGRDLTYINDDPARSVPLLAHVLRALHAADVHSVFSDADPPPGEVIVHGDACLPNIMFDPATGEPTGLVDVGEMRVGCPRIDVAAACWSIGYNLEGGWGVTFLRRYGWDPADERTVRQLAEEYAAG